MLKLRQMLPVLSLHVSDGRIVRGWDFKQKKNLIIAFLHNDCALCAEFLRHMALRSMTWRENDAVVLAATLAQPSRVLAESAKEDVIVGVDLSGRAALEFLGKQSLGPSDLVRPAVFLSDRYGELAAMWEVNGDHNFPEAGEIAKHLQHAEMSCDSCANPAWED